MLKKLIVFLLLSPIISNELSAQFNSINISGQVKSKSENIALPFVNVILMNENDSSFISGTVSDSIGNFQLSEILPGKYLIFYHASGYKEMYQNVYVGNLSQYLNTGSILLEKDPSEFKGASVKMRKTEVDKAMDKKTFTLDKNISQSGSSVLQAVQNLPGVTIQDGKIMIRGSDKVIVLIDGKQTALTGFGGQVSLDNIPASAIERIEIINNPSAKYDANGTAGIINIILKKESKQGLNGKFTLATGLGALWIKKNNLPGIRPQYQGTQKLNPSLSLNYLKKKINVFFQGDYFHNPTLNKNEFVTRVYDSGLVVNQQTKRNRNTNVVTSRLGMDWRISEQNLFSASALFSRERILDNGDEPFFDDSIVKYRRLWQFLEDELKETFTGIASFQHKYAQPGRVLNAGITYTFHREDEKYYFTNFMPTYTGYDAFKLLSDEHVTELNTDYVQPLKKGHFDMGFKFRWRDIPTNMKFFPGLNSPLDSNAGGWAKYNEIVPALYGNYVYESKKLEIESGLRIEYVNVNYKVDPNNHVYSSNGYEYFKPFANLRLAYKLNQNQSISAFYNRRVDRPNELDLRVFPKYDDAEIIKVGNPALRPQYTNSFEIGYKNMLKKGYVYLALYDRMSSGTITRIGSTAPNSSIIYSSMQNTGKSAFTGMELMYSVRLYKKWDLSCNINAYQNTIDAFDIQIKYPVNAQMHNAKQTIYSGNLKLNATYKPSKTLSIQMLAIYLAPDLIPQGKIGRRFSLNMGIKKTIQKGKGELFLNANDLLNTMVIKKEIDSEGFKYYSYDYYETQVIRIGYAYKF